MKSNINSFTFYFDYFNLVDTLPIEDKQILLVAITDYVFKDIEPSLSGHNQAIFNTLKAQLNVSKNKSNNAKKNNQIKIKQKSNENQIKIKKDNKTSILSFIFNDFIFIKDRGLLRGKIEDWISYKEEIGKPFTAYSLKSFLNRIETKFNQFGEESIIDLIDYSLSNRYEGLIWERLKEKNILPDWYKKENKKKEYEFSEEDKKRFGIT